MAKSQFRTQLLEYVSHELEKDFDALSLSRAFEDDDPLLRPQDRPAFESGFDSRR